MGSLNDPPVTFLTWKSQAERKWNPTETHHSLVGCFSKRPLEQPPQRCLGAQSQAFSETLRIRNLGEALAWGVGGPREGREGVPGEAHLRCGLKLVGL